MDRSAETLEQRRARIEKDARINVAAKREAVRRNAARGVGANIEAGIRLVRTGQAMHGTARR